MKFIDLKTKKKIIEINTKKHDYVRSQKEEEPNLHP